MNYIIFAGGTGTRLWPLSRLARPKQFTRLISELMMIEDTIKRVKVGDNYQQIYIATTEQLAHLIHDLLPDFPTNQLIIDPDRRDTGPAMAYAAALLCRHEPDEPMMFLPADHFIRDTKLFCKTLAVAEKIIQKQQRMVVIGIVPTFPTPNLGYTKIGRHLRDEGSVHLFEFAGQIEKPPLEVAREFVADGHYLWNGGYFLWTPRLLLEAYHQSAPEVGQKIEKVVDLMEAGETLQAKKLYGELPKISIDYLVMEKIDPKQVVVIKGEFGWSDIGSWEQVYEQLSNQTDEHGNLTRAKWLGIDTTSSVIYGQPEKMIATIGLSDMVIIDTPDALLICPKGRAADVKKIVDELTKHEHHEHL